MANTTNYKGYEITEQHIADMREWLSDLSFADEVCIEDLTDLEVIGGVNRHWDGGIANFLLCQN